MKVFFSLLAALLLSLYSLGQNSESLFGKFPGKFQYKNELDRFKFVIGGHFKSGILWGADSIHLPIVKEVSINSFYMNQYEVSNNDYREFVQYVGDSMAHRLLGHLLTKGTVEKIDWSKKIDWNHPQLEPMRLPADKEIYGKKEMDPEKFIYRFENGETAAIYPDTLVWIRDFAYSYNEPLTKRYFSHPAFGKYPVLGVSQKQAMAYCDWKTRQWNAALQAAGSQSKVILRLPSAHEWEYAAQAGSEIKTDSILYDFILFDPSQTKGYPNPAHGEAGKKIRNHGYKYNFGRIDDTNGFIVKDYADDGSFYSAPCNAYNADQKGFFNLHGNVAEWTSSTGGYLISEQDAQQASGRLNKLTADFPHSPLANMTPAAAHAYLNRFIVVKGGSWESVPFYLQPGANQFYDASAQHSYIGFRVAMEIEASQ